MSQKPNNIPVGEGKTLQIWQQNINKSRVCQLDLIGSGRLAKKEIDIVALQEPYMSHEGNTIAVRHWTVIYPTTHASKAEKTRSVMLIRNDMPSDAWEQIDFESGDVTAIRIHGHWGKLVIFNIYNDCDHNHTLQALTSFHERHRELIYGKENSPSMHHLLWIGDFN